MPFIDQILQNKSLSIVGLEKNTGKTECLNFVLKRLNSKNVKFTVTSIGIDGETVDQVTNTNKPEIEIYKGNYFITSEYHYLKRKIISEIIDVSRQKSSLGRFITAKSIVNGKVILSGPHSSNLLKTFSSNSHCENSEIFIIDGALSRLSSASPAVSEGMILNTGASVSTNMQSLVSKTDYVCNLIKLPQYKSLKSDELIDLKNGIWAIGNDNLVYDLKIPSVFLLDKNKENLFKHGHVIYASGAVGDAMLNFLKSQKECSETVLIIKDFSRIFASKETVYAFLNKGGQIKVLLKTKLIAICVNPTSPFGFSFNSDSLKKEISDKTGVNTFDVRDFD